MKKKILTAVAILFVGAVITTISILWAEKFGARPEVRDALQVIFGFIGFGGSMAFCAAIFMSEED